MPTQSPFQTSRLPDLPPTQRLQLQARSSLIFLRRVYPGILIGFGLALLVWSLTVLARPVPPAARVELLPTTDLRIAQFVATPALLVPAKAAMPVHVVTAAWSPDGQTYGTIAIDGQVELIEQYRGWGRFRTAHMTQDLWAPIAQLAPVLNMAQLITAPEIAPTSAPTSAPTQSAPPPAVPVLVEAPAPELSAVPPEGQMVTLIDEPGLLVEQLVQAVGATPFPTPYMAPGGSTGGSWDD